MTPRRRPTRSPRPPARGSFSSSCSSSAPPTGPPRAALALQIDRESRDELPVIPLWQLGDHYAWRDRLTGPGKGAGELYQGIETWEIAPWIAKDPWEEH